MIFIKRYNIIKYLKREIKARPDDNISDIISSVLTSGVVNKNKVVLKRNCNNFNSFYSSSNNFY